MTSPIGLPLNALSADAYKEIQETRAPKHAHAEGTLRILREKDGVLLVARFPDTVKEDVPCPSSKE